MIRWCLYLRHVSGRGYDKKKDEKKMMVLSAETRLGLKITGLCHKNVHNSQE